ncbi:YggS family pyridoxal phosphate-dependent enzyme [Pseudoflavitalea sp. X16]|uniref:YggS family pyridoxal phosphate-dependent enzyme n=1 Tax=Paraflavitalea devenefica TaxID=2716334 RepID=UPI00141F49B9|nr:YggS family pyridoxal phosphate-dependent enzyme [Paraflavitalea devenefica]NII26885.1 YggS family pyridoxal phosphate-dependent enzyme [Paraflavitalea devenefica]
MAVNIEQYNAIKKELGSEVTLVAVSKTKPVEDIKALYDLGQRDFGENYVQELVEKQVSLPPDIRWHFIGHLQSNKVKYIAPFVHLIHGVDSYKLLLEIEKQAAKNLRVIHCLLQVHIAQEETKFGFDAAELADIMNILQKGQLQHVQVLGLMGMASFTEDEQQLQKEFIYLKGLFNEYFPASNAQLPVSDPLLTTLYSPFPILSMGMSSDYQLAIACGSNMVRVGSLLFGARF